MGIAENQGRVLLGHLSRLRPHWRRDPALPQRIDHIIRGDGRAGARDRRLYRELIYTALRHLPWIEPSPPLVVQALARLCADIPATRQFRMAHGAAPEPPPATVAERAALIADLFGVASLPCLLPEWFREECPEAFAPPDYDAINRRAPLWLRLQGGDPGGVGDELAAHGWNWRRSHALPAAIEVEPGADVDKTDAYRRGGIEIQDAGSQAILEAVGPKGGERWLDACAGAGGKALQLAVLLGPGGQVDTCDVRPEALEELGRRSARAGLAGRIRRPAAPEGIYDGVLVDAPCSGSGTWRRAPHLKWTTTPGQVRAHAVRQQRLLAQNAVFVRPGGRLIYATCSLCRTENERVVEEFLAEFPAFVPDSFSRPELGERRGPGLLIPPALHDSDGYFCACLKRI